MTTKIERSINKIVTLATANGFTVFSSPQKGYLDIMGERLFLTVTYCSNQLHIGGSYLPIQKAFVAGLLGTTSGLYKDCVERTVHDDALGIYAAFELLED